MFTTLFTRPRRLTVAASAGVVALLAAHPTLARSVGADVWNYPAIDRQMRDASDEGERLEAEGEVVCRRIAVKEGVVAALLAGRATLADATASFAELNSSRPMAQSTVRALYPGASDREKTARNVIAYALDRTPAADRPALARRLDGELRQMLAR